MRKKWGRKEDGEEIEEKVMEEGLEKMERKVEIGENENGEEERMEMVKIGINEEWSCRKEGEGRIERGSIGGERIIDRVVIEVIRNWIEVLKKLEDFRMWKIERKDDREGERKKSIERMIRELIEYLRNRMVEVDIEKMRGKILIVDIRNVFWRIGLKMIKENEVIGDIEIRMKVGRKGKEDEDRKRREVEGKEDEEKVMEEIFEEEMREEKERMGKIVNLWLNLKVEEGVEGLREFGRKDVEIESGRKIKSIKVNLRRSEENEDGKMIGREGGCEEDKDFVIEEINNEVMSKKRRS